MDRHLRPERLDTDPTSVDASKHWRHWFRTFENFVSALGDQNPDKLSTLINFVSPTIYELIADCDDYDSAIQILESTFDKPANEIFLRHQLSTCRQEPGQTLDQYLQKLRTLAKNCNFTQVSAEQHKEEAIRDAFISGLLSSSIRQRLLEHIKLDLQTAYDNARSLEMAEKQNQSYNPTTSNITPSVRSATKEADYPRSSESQEPTTNLTAAAFTNNQKCYFCGYRKHPRSKCPARDASCKTCGKKGHFQAVCKSSSTKPVASSMIRFVSPIIAAAGPASLRKALISVSVGDNQFTALIDSGSTESYVNSSIPQKYGWNVVPSTNVISMASTNLTRETKGHCFVEMKYGNTLYSNIKMSLLPNACADMILGHDFICRHSEMKIVLEGKYPPLVVCGVTAASVEPPTLFGNLSSDCKPIATKSRRYSVIDERFIENEVSNLLKSDIIEPSSSPWRAQVLVTSDERHKKRMVIDYSQTINRFTYLDAYPQKRLDKMIETISQYDYFSALDLQSAYHQIPLREDERHYTAFEAAGNLYQFKRIPFGVTNGVSAFQRIIDMVIQENNLKGTFAYVDNVTICGADKADHDKNLQLFLATAEEAGITFNKQKSVICVQEIDILGYRVSKRTIKPDPDRLQALKDMPLPTSLKSQQRIVGVFSYYAQWIPKFSDKIIAMTRNTIFPVPEEVKKTFDSLKKELENALLVTIDPYLPLIVETDASDVAISATLNQDGRPVAFFSRLLTASERNHSAVEKEAYAIVEAVRKWRHYLISTTFKLVTDQKSVAFIYDHKQKGKVKK